MLGAPSCIPPNINNFNARPMIKPKPPAFDPADVAESNATGYPEPYRAASSEALSTAASASTRA